MKCLAQCFVMIVVMAGIAMAAPPVHLIGDHPDHVVLKQIVSKQILENPRYQGGQFSLIQTEVIRKDNQKYLLTFLKHQKEYSFETAIVTLNMADNAVQRVEVNVKATRIEQIKPSIIEQNPFCPDSKVDVVYATPCDDIASAVAGVNDACNSATKAGYVCKTLIGKEATTIAYKRYLTSCPNLKALGNIGHGGPECILLADGPLCYPWFDSLPDNKLKGKVLYYNSCEVHNSPLETAIMGGGGTRTYIGGNIGLDKGTSENVFKCFWQRTLIGTPPIKMGPALSGCEQNFYPTPDAHGISGDTGLFKRLILIPTPHRIPR